MEVHDIVIVGGGICGLATALALHRKGIISLVLEKSETLRAGGAAISLHGNGWRALDQLGVGAELRKTATLITAFHSVSQKENKSNRVPVSEELRCVKRKDLVETLAKSLPAGTIRFGYHIAAIDEEAGGLGAVVTTVDGSTIKAKVLIGCDGTKSEIAKYLGLHEPSLVPGTILRGFTKYPHGHTFGSEFLQLRGKNFFVGRLPVTESLVHFFVSTGANPSADITRDVGAMTDFMLENLQGGPKEISEMVQNSDPESLYVVTKVRYVPPWQVMLGSFQRGTVTVAGDAMHVMGPFIGQGGSSALEDAVVLARSLSWAVPEGGLDGARSDRELHEKMIMAIGKYVRERRLRVAMLSLESFVMGSLPRAESIFTKLVYIAILALLGSRSLRHTKYNCGGL